STSSPRRRASDLGLVQGLAEPGDVLIALGRRGAERDQVIVVEVQPVGAELGQAVHRLYRVQRRTSLGPERVAGLPAHSAQAERELVGGGRSHGAHPLGFCLSSQLSPLTTTVTRAGRAVNRRAVPGWRR